MTLETRAKISAAHMGKTVSHETRAKLSAIVKAAMTPERLAKMSAWASAAMTPERRALVSRQSTGRKQTPEARAKRSASLMGKKCPWTSARRKGKRVPPPKTEDARQRMMKNLLHKTPEQKAKWRESYMKTREVVGFGAGIPKGGRSAAGCQTHGKAKHWVIRSPRGVVYEFPNLRGWIATNIYLFHDNSPESKTPLFSRAASGIASLGTGKKGTHWNGWCLVAIRELAENSGIDLAGRTNEKPNCLKILQSKFPNIQSTEGP